MITKSLFDHAGLSFASYATLTSAPLNGQIRALQNAELTLTQSQLFAARYSVLVQVHDLATNFDATVFKGGSGNLTVAFRGTHETEGAE